MFIMPLINWPIVKYNAKGIRTVWVMAYKSGSIDHTELYKIAVSR